jgi:lipopolysaccharide transport system permease protein
MIVQFINLTIPLVLSILILKLYGVNFTLASFLFPILIIPLILLGSGLGLLISVLKIVAIDLTNLFDRFICITMFFTPIVYGKNVDSLLLQTLMKYNPLTYLVSYPRDILVNTHSVAFSTYCFCALASILFFVWAVHFFCKITPIVIQRIIL